MADKSGDVLLDLRSDTVTRPTPGMLKAMAEAPLGDDVFDDDPTVHALQTKVAQLCGKEAALFMVTGTMANQIGVRSLVALRPSVLYQEVICELEAHVYRNECGGLGVHSRAQPFPLSGPEGHMTADLVAANLHLVNDLHRCITTVVALEVPMGGAVMPYEEIEKIRTVTKKHGVWMHLDGARLWNACVATGVPIEKYCAQFDSISLCLSKGLGTPMGSVLVGSKELIDYARQFRKGFGGAWRQAGLMAACGIYAIDHQWQRLKEDHDNCRYLTEALKGMGFQIVNKPETNILVVDSSSLGVTFDHIRQEMKRVNVIMLGSGNRCRLVTHIQTPRPALEQFVAHLASILAAHKRPQAP